MHATFVLLSLLPLATLSAAVDRSRAAARHAMVEEQLISRDITDERTLQAMRTVPRHCFVPADVRGAAYHDSPLPIGYGQTISQPYIVAYMTQLAQLRRDNRVLEVGTGSGYQAAVAAEISDHVYSIEIVPELAARAAATLKQTGYERVQLRIGDGYHGWPEAAPFDAIIVTAGAEDVPPQLVEQLADGGRMIIPLGPQHGTQNLMLVTKHRGQPHTRTLIPVRFVPFTREKQ